MRTAMLFCLLAVLAASVGCAAPTGLLLRLRMPGGLATDNMVPVWAEASLADVKAAVGPNLRNPAQATETVGGQVRVLPAQVDRTNDSHLKLCVLLPGQPAGTRLVTLRWAGEAPPPPPDMTLRVSQQDGKITIRNRDYTIVHDPAKQAGLPSSITWASGKVFDQYTLNDRVYDHGSQTGYRLGDCPDPKVELTASGPLYAEVRVTARYLKGEQAPPSAPQATYTFRYVAGSPLVRVIADMKQKDAFGWSELHLLEFYHKDPFFSEWAVGNPVVRGPFKDEKKGDVGNDWGALIEGQQALALLGEGRIYDGASDYGRYLHGPWVRWDGTETRLRTTIWIGETEDPVKAIQAAAAADRQITALVLTPSLATDLDKLRQQPVRGPWLASLVEGFMAQGLLKPADAETAVARFLRGKGLPQGQVPIGNVGVLFYSTPTLGVGIADVSGQRGFYGRLVSLFDLKHGREMLGASGELFRVTFVDPDGNRKTVTSLSPWGRGRGDLNVRNTPYRWTWSNLNGDDELQGVSITLAMSLQGDLSRWKIKVDNPSTRWSVDTVTCPVVAAGPLGEDPADDNLYAPAGYGKYYPNPTGVAMRYDGTYPNGWCCMQWLAVTDAQGGLYVAAHDPTASNKNLFVRSDGAGTVALTVEATAPNATVPGNDYENPGDLVLGVVGGGWYPATRVYRSWLDKSAPWWPEPGKYSRSDVPQWVANNQAWSCTGGFPKDCVPQTKALAKGLDVPTALHWYNWHVIPFDNDYPHYFPTKEGFRDGVKELQAAGIRVMPYINGRLWDTGSDDFATEAFPAAAKGRDGKNYIEEYGSKRKLAPMCPYTQLWQEKVRSIVKRLVSEEGVDGVYIDQVAAAAPAPCYDKSHGHPLGGGHWWVDGYWKMLGELQQEIARVSPEKMLTTESNAESYAKYFDAYLMCNSLGDREAPLFPAVYAGKIQTFGQYMQRGDWDDLGRMAQRQGRVFTWGTQLWWGDPNVITSAKAGPWLHDLAQLRRRLNEFFLHGQMFPPPPIREPLEEVTQTRIGWGGRPEPIRSAAVLATAWRTEDGKVALPIINISAQARTVTFDLNLTNYGFATTAQVAVQRVGPAGSTPCPGVRGKCSIAVNLAPCEAAALVLSVPKR